MELKKVSKSYGTKKVISEISLPIKEGAITAFIGPNGAGKSTLLAMMSRLTPKDTGFIYIDGGDVKTWKQDALAKKLSILKQSNSFNLKLTVRELVSFGRFPYSKGRLKKEDEEKIQEALVYLGLVEMAEDDVGTLSGGQLQRAYIAMVLAQDTDYILLDEPLNNLDMNYGVQMMKTLRRLVDELGKTIILVIHDINFAASYADEIVAMKNGELFASGTTDEMMTKKVLDPLYEMDIRIVEIEGKRFCLYFNE
ncbi:MULTISPECIES: iron ABC transporter ATP-binding protein [Carnobacterium]|uniref:Iron ABC transporter ATP-binding protein n=1 Tax=Carnobacterium divergens TaxID=2748 RepID=A0A5F0MCS8_CARDV|nr:MULTISPECIES: ATP-binding cassette domain-containing protein [Carnobacterium]MDT1939148.1 ATP-binding cassette domain-containing protein [Carnobacterium divergens]MDT1941586.1 ATP-binding cassette domain-containing protein [Carnobacterium divergens]MDT1947384.1 ATP-binding cassette domain-containing protein [Carnobacterium divergens]MDT1949823.1 ATP-binding cassette domain-containing protein [Carnobacterium divergens]MDT1955001.1 ATP-binding cassette domain-containing protein [Carnobacteriu